jgi:hypothetical protein
VVLIEDATSDSLTATGIWGSQRIDAAAGKVVLGKKPVFFDLIVLEQEAAYNAEHVYCYDSSFTKAQVRKLYKNGGRDNPTIRKAIDSKQLIFIEEVSP